MPLNVWNNITPPVGSMVPPSPATYGVVWVVANPSRAGEIWCCVDQKGLWKSTDYGATWTGGQISPVNGTNNTTYFDSPNQLRWHPTNPLLGYLTVGVRSETADVFGFWKTTDGGANWFKPAGYVSISSTVGSQDVTSFSVDPTDFNHVIVGGHSPWTGFSTSGILETTDGGSTWTAHNPPAGWPGGTQPPAFLYDPATGQGNANTWLVGTDGSGIWRTTNAGSSWTQVTSAFSAVHVGQHIMYLPDGRLIAGAGGQPIISSDNGLTWAALSALPSGIYTGVCNGGDGYIYTGRTWRSFDYMDQLWRAPVSNPTSWTELTDLSTGDGPVNMISQDGILYWSGWTAGLFRKRLF